MCVDHIVQVDTHSNEYFVSGCNWSYITVILSRLKHPKITGVYDFVLLNSPGGWQGDVRGLSIVTSYWPWLDPHWNPTRLSAPAPIGQEWPKLSLQIRSPTPFHYQLSIPAAYSWGVSRVTAVELLMKNFRSGAKYQARMYTHSQYGLPSWNWSTTASDGFGEEREVGRRCGEVFGARSHTVVTIGIDRLLCSRPGVGFDGGLSPMWTRSWVAQWANTIVHQSPAYAMPIMPNGVLTDSVVESLLIYSNYTVHDHQNHNASDTDTIKFPFVSDNISLIRPSLSFQYWIVHEIQSFVSWETFTMIMRIGHKRTLP